MMAGFTWKDGELVRVAKKGPWEEAFLRWAATIRKLRSAPLILAQLAKRPREPSES